MVSSQVQVLTEDDIWDRAAEILNAHPYLVHYDDPDAAEAAYGRHAGEALAQLQDYAWLIGRLEA